jgi:hypothetical protein
VGKNRLKHKSSARDTAKRRRSSALESAALALILTLMSLIANGVPAAAQTASGAPLRVAFFGFELINTSLQTKRNEEDARTVMVGEQFRQMLEESDRYQFVMLSPELKKKIAQSSNISGCNGCQIDWARQEGADLAAWGTVQKVSNLILNINLIMDCAKDGRHYFMRSVDIRGNTDESWRRGIRYLIRHYLLDEYPANIRYGC